MPLNAIQVELVGGDPWAAILPAIAILISLISVALTLWFRWSDKARVELEINYALVGWDTDDFFKVTATNRGRSGVTVVESVVLVPDVGDQQLIRLQYLDIEDRLPWKLGPGESSSRFFPHDWVKQTIGEQVPGAQSIRALAETGHGNVKSKPLQIFERNG